MLDGVLPALLPAFCHQYCIAHVMPHGPSALAVMFCYLGGPGPTTEAVTLFWGLIALWFVLFACTCMTGSLIVCVCNGIVGAWLGGFGHTVRATICTFCGSNFAVSALYSSVSYFLADVLSAVLTRAHSEHRKY